MVKNENKKDEQQKIAWKDPPFLENQIRVR